VRRVLPTLLLLLVSTVVALGLGEAFLRVFHPQTLGFSWWTPDGLQVHVPGRSGIYQRSEYRIPVHFNEMGFRGPEFAVPKPPDTFRILALGDSMVEGMQVREDQVLTTRIQQALADVSPHVEVLNLGVSGYGTDDELDVLRRYGPELQPDLVLVFVTLGNDVRNNLVQGHCSLDHGALACRPLERLSGFKLWRKHLKNLLATHSQLYQLWRAFTDRRSWALRAPPTDDPGLDPEWAFLVDSQRDPEPAYQAKGVALTGALLAELRRVAAGLGAPTWVVLLPHREQVEAARWQALVARAGAGAQLVRDEPQQALTRAADAAGIPVVLDPLPALLAADARGEKSFFRIDGHIDAAGHALVAEQVVAALRARHPWARAGSGPLAPPSG
jgi:hypothetical protein